MRIALSLHPLIHHYRRGIHFYIKSLVENIVRINRKDEILLFYLGKERQELNLVGENSVFLPYKFSWERLPRSLRWSWEFTFLPWEVKKHSPQVLHIPDLSGILFSPAKVIITVHDITPYLFPHYLPDTRERLKYRLKLLSLKRADKIISISRSTKDDLVKYLHVPPQKITVIPYGVEGKFKPISRKKCKKWIEEKWGIAEDFILYVGALSPNKNVGRLLEAFALLIKAGIKGYPLLIVASLKNPNYPSLLRKTRELGIDKWVYWLDAQPQEKTLVYLYNACTLFAFPSLYEGFGLPPLEAMACGAPVIASNTSSLPEVVGDAGSLVNPEDPREMQESMRKILLSSSLREELKSKAIKRAKEFSWQRTAEKTLEVYREVMKG
ncbi:MAG: glycosyltransferase family 4 protein [Caldiserica bacterium]|nr:glycosyltransferase family 4 protein [Caldisericota bacterium]